MPISYAGMKCIMEHVEANRRFHIATRCPSLRNIHNHVPLTIQSLEFIDSKLMVNGFEHSFHCFVTATDGQELPEEHREKNEKGGAPYDLDKYGLIVDDNPLEPTDVQVVPCASRRVRLPRGAMLQWGASIERSQIKANASQGGPPAREYKTHICYKLNGTGNFSFPPHIKMRDAYRQHLKNFFPKSCSVRNFHIESRSSIFRFPEGFKIRIERVHSYDGLYYLKKFDWFLDQQSFPLKKLKTFVDVQEVLSEPILRNAEALELELKRYVFDGNSWAHLLVGLPNRSIHAFVSDEELPIDDIKMMADHWIENPQVIGTKFSAKITHVSECIEAVREHIGATSCHIPSRMCNHFKYAAAIPNGLNTEINIYGYESPYQLEELEKMEKSRWMPWIDGKPWMIVLEVMELGSAVHIE